MWQPSLASTQLGSSRNLSYFSLHLGEKILWGTQSVKVFLSPPSWLTVLYCNWLVPSRLFCENCKTRRIIGRRRSSYTWEHVAATCSGGKRGYVKGTCQKLSPHTRGRVAALCLWVMFPLHFLACVAIVISLLQHVPATCPLSVNNNTWFCRLYMSLRHVPVACPYVCGELQYMTHSK